MPDPSIKTHQARKWRVELGAAADTLETLAVEEPLEIRLGGRRFTLTMRTPGHDRELAAGFLLAEGFINSNQELGEVRDVLGSKGEPEPNAIDVVLRVPAAGLRERLKRNFTISSSCGVCGKTSIESIQRRIAPLTDTTTVPARVILALPHLMRQAQHVFSATGGLHAAALFHTPSSSPPPLAGDSFRSSLPDQGEGKGEGPAALQTSTAPVELAVLREDVGRHNAVDKVIGHALISGWLPLNNSLMMVSGRLSFEIVQKAAAAGIPILAAVSAPSSLAVELAEEIGMTLVGFVRDAGFNVYTRPLRIIV
ncbi:MAG TPA: formate dehydrogenase accessory sulfurtransferase FdhD [Candidatus Binataceae bacterium]|jgi:FdhD protein|nr:formate dehydrogenase accessory sulfurtransferase FdhD [Candidatus Binataceae bacterium]